MGDVRFVGVNLGEAGGGDVRTFAQDVKQRLGDTASVVAAFGAAGGRPTVVVAVSPAAQELGFKAGDLVKTATGVLGGGGGGKPDLAQGGGQDASKIDEAIAAVRRELQERG